MRKTLITTVVVALAATGCASSGSGGSDYNSDLITTEELRDVNDQVNNAYDAVRRLRSSWLRARSSSFSGDRPTPPVFVNGTRFGETDALYSINVSDIERMEYLDSRDATTQFGTGYTAGAILVTTF